MMRYLTKSQRRLTMALAFAAGVSLPSNVALTQDSVAQLRADFEQPPEQARPWTWFHVMSGNMNREGLTRDLESIADVGIGGIVLFHVTQGISYGPVLFNSPEHLELIEHVAAECERLGLEFTFHNADGWSSTGGPWITPAQSMKRLVWTEALVSGGSVSTRLEQPATQENYYEEIATVAYPALAGEMADATTAYQLSSSDPSLDLSVVTDGNPGTMAQLSVTDGEQGWVQFSYEEPVAIGNLRLFNAPARTLQISLQVSDDGENFRPLFAFPKTRILKNEWEVDTAFAPVTGQHFRVVLSETTSFGEVALSQQTRLDNPSAHSTLGYVFGQNLPRARSVARDAVIDPATIIDLSDHVAADGTLQAQLPEGDWTIMRFGYTSTGARNVNPSREGGGLEVDKFDPAAFRTHYDEFLGPVINRTRAVAPNALSGVMIDSYEVGGQNWTAGYETMFEEEHGVDLVRWLPIFAGRFVSSGHETSAMFDRVRRFNTTLTHENYYGEFARLMAEDGLESIIQPYGNGPMDELTVGSIASVPAGEFWVRRTDLNRLNGAASVARIYDRPVAAAEAFTGTWDDNWNFNPAFGKQWGDRAWVAGINQFFFHRFAHQANTHVMPGMTMNRWGSHFDRTQPWWDEGGSAWFNYMARGQHMLRQGNGVADVAMLVGSDSPVQCPEQEAAEGILPVGVQFDCVDTPTLLSRGEFVDGAYVLPHGVRYEMLWWPHENAPRAAELARLEEARAAGVTIAMANHGDEAGTVFTDAGLLPRVSSAGVLPSYTHRHADGSDIVFIFNDADEARSFDLCFRFDGRAAEVWNPVTGQTDAVSGSVDADGCTNLSVSLAPFGSRFLVFDDSMAFVPAVDLQQQELATLNGGWSIAFDPLYGNAGTLRGAALFDWSTSEDDEIRHWSGKATYRNTLDVSADQLTDGAAIMLDLGQVGNVATVRVNGEEVGTIWTAPHTINIAPALRAGENAIEIEVANLWVNRLIGDAALPDTSGYEPEIAPVSSQVIERNMVDWYSANEPPPPSQRRTFATHYFQEADDPLVPSGLIGPVTVTVLGESE